MALRRRRYQTAELMAQAVDQFFLDRMEDNRPITMTGLARELGFSSLGSFYRYETYEDQDFKWVIQDARMRVMDAYEGKLHGTGAAGAMFALKNMDSEAWRDKTEQVIDQRTLIAEIPEQKTLLAKMRARLEQNHMKEKEAIELAPDPEEDDSWI